MSKNFKVPEDELKKMEKVKELFNELYEMREDIHVVRVDDYAYVVLEWYTLDPEPNEFEHVSTFFEAKKLFDFLLDETCFCYAAKSLNSQGIKDLDIISEYMESLKESEDSDLAKRCRWYQEQWEKISK